MKKDLSTKFLFLSGATAVFIAVYILIRWVFVRAGILWIDYIIICLLFGVNYYYIFKFISPIKRLTREAGNIIKTNDNNLITIQGKDEVALLINMLNFLSLEVEERKRDLQVYDEQVSIQNSIFNKVKEGLEKRVCGLFNIFEIAKELNSTLSPQKIIQIIIFSCMGQIGVNNAAILLADDDKYEEFYIKMYKGLPLEIEKKIKIFVKGTICASLIKQINEQKEPKVIEREDIESICSKEELESFEQMKTSLLVPLYVKDKIIGFISIGSKLSGKDFNDDDKEFISVLAGIGSLALENASLYFLAITDGLTKLYARRYFQLRLEGEIKRSKRYKHSISLVIIEVEDLKNINKIYGRSNVDVILLKIAEIIKNNSREIDLVSRYDAERFAVFMPEIDKKGALTVVNRLYELINKKIISLNGRDVILNFHSGVASYPADAEDINELFDYAEEVLSKDKEKK